MRIGEANEVTELLRSLPDMRPPEDAWKRIRESQRHRHPFVWSGAALAACVALAAVAMGIISLTREDVPVEPAETYLVRSESAPMARAADRFDVGELRRRSQSMERMLRGLPPRTQLVRADVAGAIAELQDRIAAVDYELNYAAQNRVSNGRSSIARWPSASEAATVRSGQRSAPTSRDLWRQRVDLMDRLVRVRYAEAGVEAY